MPEREKRDKVNRVVEEVDSITMTYDELRTVVRDSDPTLIHGNEEIEMVDVSTVPGSVTLTLKET